MFALPNSYNRICAKIKRVLRHITRSDQRRIYLIPSQGFDSLIFLPSEMKIELGLGWAHVHQVTSVVLMRFFRYAPQNNYWTPKLKWLECRSDAVPKLTKLVRRINGKVFGAKTNLSWLVSAAFTYVTWEWRLVQAGVSVTCWAWCSIPPSSNNFVAKLYHQYPDPFR